MLDRTGKAYFLTDGPHRWTGAAPASSTCLPELETARYPAAASAVDMRSAAGDKSAKTWLVCRHLCPSYNFIDSYLRFRYFIICDSHVFCHECHRERSYAGTSAASDINWDYLALTDRQLQEQVFHPLYQVNFDLGEKPDGAARDHIATWYACTHLSGWTNLRQYIFSRKTIYFIENNVICTDCLETFVRGCRDEFDRGLILMRDSELQQSVIDNLYLINYEYSLAHGFVEGLLSA
jgi:hypothetical protein